MDSRGKLGFNVKLILETGEETGSPGLAAFCEQHKDRLKADLFIASDGPRIRPELPTIYGGSRGVINFELRIEARKGTLQTNQDGKAFLFYANSEMTGMAIKRFNAESLVAFGYPVNEHLILGSTDVMNGIDGLIFHASGDGKLAQMENAIAS